MHRTETSQVRYEIFLIFIKSLHISAWGLNLLIAFRVILSYVKPEIVDFEATAIIPTLLICIQLLIWFCISQSRLMKRTEVYLEMLDNNRELTIETISDEITKKYLQNKEKEVIESRIKKDIKTLRHYGIVEVKNRSLTCG